MLTSFLRKLGYIHLNSLKDQLNFARSVGKRLDEHREEVEAIHASTNHFNKNWHIWHMATQDDYLMRLYFLVHGFWPDSSQSYVDPVRPRPYILGACLLPEYTDKPCIELLNGQGEVKCSDPV